jgi:hypothetical protein
LCAIVDNPGAHVREKPTACTVELFVLLTAPSPGCIDLTQQDQLHAAIKEMKSHVSPTKSKALFLAFSRAASTSIAAETVIIALLVDNGLSS